MSVWVFVGTLWGSDDDDDDSFLFLLLALFGLFRFVAIVADDVLDFLVAGLVGSSSSCSYASSLWLRFRSPMLLYSP